MSQPANAPLSGKRILVVEDEYWLASEIAAALTDQGAEVLGPAGTLAEAQRLLEQQPDCAVLDINLQGDSAFPIAARLQDADVPFAIATGYDRDSFPESLANVPSVQKPFDPKELKRLIPSLIARAAGAG